MPRPNSIRLPGVSRFRRPAPGGGGGSGGGDVAAENVALLMNFDGADGTSDNADFLDEGPYGWAGSPYGSGVEFDTAQKKFGTSSLRLSSSNSSVVVGRAEAILDPSSGAKWTIQMWVRLNSLPSRLYFLSAWASGDARSWLFYWDSATSELRFAYMPDGTDAGTDLVNSWSPSTNTWYLLEMVRDGDTAYMFVDGVLLGSHDVTGAVFDADTEIPLMIGNRHSRVGPCDMWIDSVRILNGAALHTEAHDVPTEAWTAPSPTANNSYSPAAGIDTEGAMAVNKYADDAAHRYWRVVAQVPGTLSKGSLGDLRFFDNAETKADTTGGAGSAIGGSGNFGNSFDGDEGITQYQGSNNDDVINGYYWAGWDYGSGNEKTLLGFSLQARVDSFAHQTAQAYTFEYSDNGSDWTVLFSVSKGSNFGSSETRSYWVE